MVSIPRAMRRIIGPRKPAVPYIKPRTAWATEPASGPLTPEDDVRFFITHNTHGLTGTSVADVPGIIDDVREFHMTERGWADIAYNFLVDQWGGIWEGRTGSLAAALAGTSPPRGDATGGSQGFGILACWVGNHDITPPTPAAVGAMVQLWAWLSVQYGVNVAPGSEVTFISRGSTLWPEGALVTAKTISGHRDMSDTGCPGDAGYAVVLDLQRQVTRHLG